MQSPGDLMVPIRAGQIFSISMCSHIRYHLRITGDRRSSTAKSVIDGNLPGKREREERRRTSLVGGWWRNEESHII